jgi:hypothetical protein
MEHNFERLKDHILPRSVSKHFETARREWDLVGVEISVEFDNCPCGQEIREHCYIRNRQNGNVTYVGNVCINRFIGIDTGSLFSGLKRIAADAQANPNEDLIEHAHKFGYIYEGEYKFLMETRFKRKLSPNQLAWKSKINRRIINKTVVQRRSRT